MSCRRDFFPSANRRNYGKRHIMKITVLEHPRLPSDAHFNDIANTPLWSCLMGGMSPHSYYGIDRSIRT
jgi:hypothetical protein